MGRLGFCSTTVAIKVLFLLVSLLLLVLFLQNMFYAVYAKFNLHEIRLVHQQSSWNEKPAKMVELHQMTSNLNESQRLRRITLQLSFTHYIFLPSNTPLRNKLMSKKYPVIMGMGYKILLGTILACVYHTRFSSAGWSGWKLTKFQLMEINNGSVKIIKSSKERK